MPLEIVMPKLGLTMTEGLLIEWKKKEGDEVQKGEALFVFETEKTTFEVESPQDGILGKILVRENETVPVGTIVAYLLRPGESISEVERLLLEGEKGRIRPEKTKAEPTLTREHTIAEEAGAARVRAFPLAKKIARQYNIDLRSLKGTGPDGIIIKEDVEKAYEKMQREVSLSPQVEVAPAHRLVKHTGMRRVIAKKMLASKVETAQTYMTNAVDAGKIMEYRNTLLPDIQEKFGVRMTITDIIMKITGAAIREHPIINTRWTDEGVLYLEDIHMGMALALDEGLIVPVIRHINKKGVGQIAKERVELIEKGKENGLLPDDVTGSTFTISAMGMLGVEQFTANINMPENAILAVGEIIDKPVAVDGELMIRPMMNITLTYDHRTIDGAEAGKFMRTLKSFIETPDPAILFDKRKVTIIGSGVGGYPAAIIASRMGAEVTLIEKDLIGGVCLNWGCIPTKSLLQSGLVIDTLKQAETFGIDCGDYRVNIKAIMNRKNSIVRQLRTGVEKLLAAKKIRVIKGTAALLDSKTVQILETNEKVKSDKIIITTGSKPIKLSIEGADGPAILDSDRFFKMKALPKSVAIIGGGVIGVELAHILRQLGVDVTILEMEETLIPGFDKDISLALQERTVRKGINVFTNAEVKKIVNRKRKNTVIFTFEEESEECEVEKIIVAIGRKPDLSHLNVDKVGLAQAGGALIVNEHMETNIPGIYAAGDVVGGIMLAHVATAEGECAAKNAMGRETRMNYRAIPSCIYTSPEVASVGLTEEEAKERYDIRVGRFPFHGCGKAVVLNETYGMVKIIAEKKSGKVLGVHIIGPHATDLITEAVLGMSMEITVEQLAHSVHPHPTLSEAVMEAALTLSGGAIHMP